MHLHFLGTGEAADEYNYNTSFILSTAETNILFDCGYAIPGQLWKTNRDKDFLDIIYISHNHADHSFGLPPLLLRMVSEKRQKPLTIVCPKGSKTELLAICSLGYEHILENTPFALNFLEVDAPTPLLLAGWKWTFAQTLHPRKNFAVRLNNLQSGESFAYSGDGDLTDEAKKLYFGVNWLVHEAYSFEPLFTIHTTIQETLELAVKQQVGRLFLVHMRRQDRLIAQLPQILNEGGRKLEVNLPDPGQEYEL